jgi:Flp pilus assembly protein TadG
MFRTSIQNKSKSRGAVLLLTVFLIVILLGMIAFAVDVGYIMMAKTQLQAAADSAALAAAATMGKGLSYATAQATSLAGQNKIGNQSILLASSDVVYGTWDKSTRTFTAITSGYGNAAKVTIRADGSTNAAIPMFFGRVFNLTSTNIKASATATCNPRDICFVVDLSGSMNNDTDPNNTNSINSDYPGVGTTMMQNIYTDFGYGTYPGSSNKAGEGLGGLTSSTASISALTNTSSSPLLNTKQPTKLKVGSTSYSYTVPTQYQIKSSDSSSTRTKKAYSWVMDVQLKGLTSPPFSGIMPNAKPAPNSTDSNNYNYWYAYLSANSSSIGYKTYMHYIMAPGRTRPTSTSTLYSPLSINSSDCPYNSFTTIMGNTFNFPPREMPTHAARMAIIDAIEIIKERNSNITDSNQADWVSIITFDLTGNVTVLHSLDNSYATAMQDCTTMQAYIDSAACTSTETALIAAINHITSEGRTSANKVVVLLTDGLPNLYSSGGSVISNYETNNPNSNYYGSSGYYAQDAAMMQAAIMKGSNWMFFPVEIGLEGSPDFMNRIYNISKGTITQTPTSNYPYSNATGDPTYYEQELKQIFEDIISNPKLRLVQ